MNEEKEFNEKEFNEKVSKIEKCLDELDETIQKAESEQAEYYLAEHNAKKLILNAHFNIKQELEVIFGKTREGNSAGKYGYFSKLMESEEHNHNRAILFSYWSDHSKPLNEVPSEDGKWRKNLFYKGSRFSSKKHTSNFYHLFNSVSKEEYIDKQIPIDFLTETVFSAEDDIDIGYLIIYNSKTSEFDCEEKRIKITIYEEEDDPKNNFDKLIKAVYKAKRDIASASRKKEEVKKELAKSFEENYNSARVQFKESNKDILKKLKEEIESIFKNIEITKDKLFNLIIAYQFYDHGGIIILFFPKKEKKAKAVLGLIIPAKKNEIIKNYSGYLNKLINELGRLSTIEEKIWKSVKDNINNKYLWKDIYNEHIYKYEKLCSHFEILFKAVCKKANIDNYTINFRVKKFESFYARVIDRYNGESSKATENIEQYRKSVTNPSEKHARYVFEKFYDIAGIRIIFPFKDDIKSFYNTMTEGLGENKKELEKNKFLDNKSLGIKFTHRDYAKIIEGKDNAYVSEHYKIMFNEERSKLFELEDLKDIKAELQVRTILSHGWSDVEHDLIYKSKFSKDEIEKIRNVQGNHSNTEEEPCSLQEIGVIRKGTSVALQEVDKHFNKLRKEVNEKVSDR